MLFFFNQISRSRGAWFLLMLSAFAFEICALFFQHWMQLQPCVMCIYERVAMLGVLCAGLIGMIAPKNILIRWLGLLTWGISAGWGLKLSVEHVGYQFPDPDVLFGAVCDIFVSFPSWAPLNQWFPSLFEASGDCSKVVWNFLSLSMPQWLVVIFSCMLLVFTVVIIAQFMGKPKYPTYLKYQRRMF